MAHYLCIGTYTEPILFGTGEVLEGKGEGLYLCTFENGNLCVIQTLPMRNPSYFCINKKNNKIYAVNELKTFHNESSGGISEVDYADGTMKLVAEDTTGGTDPCHIEIAPNGKFLSVANFASGAVSIFELDDNGHLSGKKTVFQHWGNSIHPVRQKSPHAHSTIFFPHESRMFVPDLGLDKVKAYRYHGSIVEADMINDIIVQPGSGPRFGEFSVDGKHLYVIDEIGCSIEHYTIVCGKVEFSSIVSTLPTEFNQENNICSDMHIASNQKYLYASNRGHDSLCCYSIDSAGNLKLIQRISCEGRTPRNFCIDPTGNYLLVGNQDSDTIIIFTILANGKLVNPTKAPFPSPVCIRFFL